VWGPAKKGVREAINFESVSSIDGKKRIEREGFKTEKGKLLKKGKTPRKGGSNAWAKSTAEA